MKLSLLTDNTSVYLVTHSTSAIIIQAELLTNEATVRKNNTENQAVLLKQSIFFDNLIKIQTAFQTAKASTRANEEKGI